MARAVGSADSASTGWSRYFSNSGPYFACAARISSSYCTSCVQPRNMVLFPSPG
jgi:hypothetical protein